MNLLANVFYFYLVSPEQQHDTIAKEIHVYDNELGDHAPKPRTPGEPPDQAGGACLQTGTL